MRPKYHNIDRARDVVGRMANSWRFNGRLNIGLLSRTWREAVGTGVAQHAKPLRLRKGELTLGIASSSWLSELQFQIPTILQRLKEVLGEGKVTSIRLKTLVSRKLNSEREKTIELPELDALDEEKVATVVKSVKDDSLRATIAAAYRRRLRVAKYWAEKALKQED